MLKKSIAPDGTMRPIKRTASYQLTEVTLAALKVAAEEEERSLSMTVERILRQWLKSNNYLQ